MTNTISNTDNIIDLRDVIARVEELRESRETLREEFDAMPENNGVDFDNWVCNQSGYSRDEQEELDALESFLDECKGNGGDEQWNGDWYPVTAIHDSYFESAMDEMLEDIGDLPHELPSYLKVTVDYDALQSDYTSVEFGGETYWVR